jgi:hypothetical protein
MTWNAEYYDQMERLYWEPNRLGCRRIVQLCDICRQAKPDSNVHGWTRIRKKLARDEVPLNDLFNLFFRIAPARLPMRLFGPCLGLDGHGVALTFVGRELQEKLDFGSDNITQPDIFLGAGDTTLMIEMKVEARSSLLQVAKYALLAGLEEECSSSRKALLLVYLTPKKSFSQIWADGGIRSGDDLLPAFRCYDPRQCGKPRLVRYFKDKYETYRSAADRLQIGFMTYTQVVDALCQERARLNVENEGGETLVRLIDGLLCEIEERKLV